MAVETLISAAITAAISIGFTWLTVGGASPVAARAVVLDAAPQSFMITLMRVVVPGLSTRRRLAKGQITCLEGEAPCWPLAACALGAAVLAALGGVALHAVVLGPASSVAPEFGAVLALKAGNGAILAIVVTATMLRWTCRRLNSDERHRDAPESWRVTNDRDRTRWRRSSGRTSSAS